jgi:16S rRNA (cytosine1402-N4)-methyltransferase
MVYHKPVLLTEVIAHLQVNTGKKYIDATLGDGGHTLEILKHGGFVLGIEINEDALNRAKERILSEGFDKQFVGVLGNFKNIDSLATAHDFTNVDGILFDLGYSSYELDEAQLGLSFLRDEPLDMRIDKSLGVTAADLVNTLPENALTKLISEYSGERYARRFARAIVSFRSLKKIQTTAELAKVLAEVASPGYENGRIHPATRTFQALRIAVNDEITNLEVTLPRAARVLARGGRLIVISFQSLEDAIVKQFGHAAQPSIHVVTKKPIYPSGEELAENSRSRSAVMRVFEKL